MDDQSFLPSTAVLLVEDDEDDYIIARDLFGEMQGWRVKLDWVQSYEEGLQAMVENRHEVCLVDYRLGAHDGVELLEAARQAGCESPIILLTGMGEQQVDIEAMRAGASDYLVKARLDSAQLERSIRYAIERKRASAQAAFEQARLAAFGGEVGLTLTRKDTLDSIMAACAQAMTRYLNATSAQISIYDAERNRLVPCAAAGSLHELPAVRIRVEEFAEGNPILIANLAKDMRVPDKEVVWREQLQSYAACPLMLEGRLVGLMSLFSNNRLTEATVGEMSSVAHGIALCVERKRSEQALDVSEGRYRAVVESVREVIFQMNPSGRWLFLNPAWTELSGHPVDQTIKTAFLDYIHPDDRAGCRQLMEELSQRQIDHACREIRLLTRAGKIRWLEFHVRPLLNAQGLVTGLSGSFNDITERKLAEAQIQKLAAFPRVNPNPVLEFAADGSLNYSNNAACQLAVSLGASGVAALLPANFLKTIRGCLHSGQNHLREESVFNGRTFTWSFFPVVASRVVHCYGTDITDVLNLEAQFRHSQKLESVARLAAGIAHDFNNVLTVIQGYSDCLMNQCRENPKITTQLKHISDASNRAAVLTRQLLTFSRKQVCHTRALDFGSLVKNVEAMLARLLGEDIALETNFETSLPAVEADAGMLEQVVMNLAVNARDAMPKGGRLEIVLMSVLVDAQHVQRQVGAREGRFVCLQVTDTGCGMDKQTLSRIFEPFFSTKAVGKGTGLGLATVYGIVRQHGGWTEVTSEVGVGTTFHIFLPATDKPVAVEAVVVNEPRQTTGDRETILLVEDESDLRELVHDFLVEYNYSVIPAANGVEALELWKQHGHKVDLLLTDVVMPEGIDGMELAAQLRREKPDLKVIYTSGYNEALSDLESNGPNGRYLAKPYRPSVLAQLIRECINEAEPAMAAAG